MATERYQLQRLLGQGMMSVVWLAHDRYEKRHVALKIMTAIPEDERRNHKAQQRFHREIEIALGLQHPHILPILDYGYTTYEGRQVPFLASLYMQEGSLAALIGNRPPWHYWSLLQTADAIQQAAESLSYLHTRTPQIVHQDVKPGNFLFHSVHNSPQRAAHLYLCDFGISRWLPASMGMASELLGTFAYMAPEQAERKIICASDQYALAVMACYLLTGQLPLQAPTNEAYINAHLYGLPIPPRVLNPQRIQAAAIDEVILRALEKKPEKRFSTILEFSSALRQAITTFEQRQVLSSAIRANPALVHVGESAGSRGMVRPIVLDAPELIEERVLDEPLPARPQKTMIAVANNGEMALPVLPMNLPTRCDLPARPRALCWSADGNMLACPLYGHAPAIVSRAGDLRIIRTRNAPQAICVDWSPDGQIVAVASTDEVHFWDSSMQEALPLVLSSQGHIIDSLCWSSNGQLAMWIEQQIFIYTLSPALLKRTSAPIPLTIETGAMRCGNAAGLCWSSDSTLLAAGASNGRVICWNIGRQLPAWQIVAAGQKVHGLTWSVDGTLLAVAFRDNRVVGWEPQSKSQSFLWEKLPAMPRMLSISVHKQIVMASSEKRLLFGLPSETRPTISFPGQLLAVWSPVEAVLATLDVQKETTLVQWRAAP